MQVTAKVTAHTRLPNNVELLSFDLYYPRMIHAQFLTHRWFSRNARSSRAMGVEEAVKEVQKNPVEIYPAAQGRGMIPKGEVDAKLAQEAWFVWAEAMASAIDSARQLADLGIHAEIANRLLEPFMHIHTKLTLTRDRIYEAVHTRTRGDSQKPFDLLAKAIVSATENSTAVDREIHLPYDDGAFVDVETILAQVAWAARVSYDKNFEEFPKERNIKLATRLVKDGHWSPFEHIARYDPRNQWTSNFGPGVLQLRHCLANAEDVAAALSTFLEG